MKKTATSQKAQTTDKKSKSLLTLTPADMKGIVGGKGEIIW